MHWAFEVLLDVGYDHMWRISFYLAQNELENQQLHAAHGSRSSSYRLMINGVHVGSVS